jgi:Leucine-rich repeat (LRR) protein
MIGSISRNKNTIYIGFRRTWIIGELKNLEYLNLENNEIETIDPGVGSLSNLVTLNLSSNKNLSAIPQTLGNLKKVRNTKFIFL